MKNDGKNSHNPITVKPPHAPQHLLHILLIIDNFSHHTMLISFHCCNHIYHFKKTCKFKTQAFLHVATRLHYYTFDAYSNKSMYHNSVTCSPGDNLTGLKFSLLHIILQLRTSQSQFFLLYLGSISRNINWMNICTTLNVFANAFSRGLYQFLLLSSM